MILVDTTILIDFLRGKESVVKLIGRVGKYSIYTTEINVFELITSAYIAKENIEKHLDKVFALLSMITVLPLDRKSTIRSGEICGKLIKEGKKIEEADCLIAGIALSNGIKKIMTENRTHFIDEF